MIMSCYLWTAVGLFILWISGRESLVTAQACARNETRVEEGRQCHPPCEVDQDCSNGTDKCICDDVCGWSCLNPNQECAKLESPRYGYILGREHGYDDSVLYYCHSGYILNGPNHRRCRSDGKWTGIPPKCVPLSTCGVVENPETRPLLMKVVRGVKTTSDMWPWHALLIRNQENKVYQSFETLLGAAVILNEHWIVTAAHLFVGFETDKSSNVDHSIFIVAGMTELPRSGNRRQDGIQIYRPKQIIVHPRYNNTSYDYDICMIRVGARMIPGKDGLFQISLTLPPYRFTFDENVRPICLPCMNEWAANCSNNTDETEYPPEHCETRGMNLLRRPAVVTGFGGMNSIDHNANFAAKWSTVLRKATMEILPDHVCLEGVRRIKTVYPNPEYTPNMICARGSDPAKLQDACRGDSGGPVVQKVTSTTGYEYWILTGVVSWGWGCANRDEDGFVFPGYYVNVTKLVPWITQTIAVREDEWRGRH